jgi:hypothetical protein
VKRELCHSVTTGREARARLVRDVYGGGPAAGDGSARPAGGAGGGRSAHAARGGGPGVAEQDRRAARRLIAEAQHDVNTSDMAVIRARLRKQGRQ